MMCLFWNVFVSELFCGSTLYIQDEDLNYECVLEIENKSVVVDASVQPDTAKPSVFFITCQPHQVRLLQVWKTDNYSDCLSQCNWVNGLCVFVHQFQ